MLQVIQSRLHDHRVHSNRDNNRIELTKTKGTKAIEGSYRIPSDPELFEYDAAVKSLEGKKMSEEETVSLLVAFDESPGT